MGGSKPLYGLLPLIAMKRNPGGASRAAQPFILTLDAPLGLCYFV